MEITDDNDQVHVLVGISRQMCRFFFFIIFALVKKKYIRGGVVEVIFWAHKLLSVQTYKKILL
jgi:hypothetical protein